MNSPIVAAVDAQPASRRRFRGWMGFAVHAAACVALLAVCPLPAAHAQNRKTWNTTTGDWSTNTNWLTSGAPSGGTDTAVFEGTAQILSATGVVAPTIGQFVFNNTGTTTLSITRMTLTGSGATNSGTGIYMGPSSGPVIIANTTLSIENVAGVQIGASQTWQNDSSSLLSVQADTGGIFLGNGANYTLTLRGAGPIRLGTVNAWNSVANLVYSGASTLTTGNFVANSLVNTTLNSGTLIGAVATSNFATSGRTLTINGGALGHIGTGTSAANFQLNKSFSVVSGTIVFFGGATGVGAEPITITVASDAALDLGSNSGTNQVTKSGAGTLFLTRSTATGFSGGYRLEQGLLVVQNGGSAADLPGTTPLGTGTFTIVGGTISAGRGQTAATMTMPSRFEGNFTIGGTAAFSFGTGTVTLGIDNPVVNVVAGATGSIGGPIVGSSGFGLTKSGPGRLILSGSSTYTGPTTVSSGTLEFTGNGSVDGNIVNNEMVFFNKENVAYTYAGVISGTGNLRQRGNNGTLTLNGVNTFSGTTSFTDTHSGFITLGSPLSLQNSGIDATTSWANQAKIRFTTAQTAVTFGGLIGSRSLTEIMDTNFGSGTSITLNPQSGRSFSYSGVIANRGANLALTKTGPGEQILSGVNTYSGPTTVSAGRLTIGGGNINSSSGVTVNGSGAEFRYNSSTAFSKPLTLTQGILSGTGVISATGGVTSGLGSVLSPGNSTGTQQFTTGVTLSPGGSYLWEVSRIPTSGTAGTDWDLINVTGGILNLTNLSSGPSGKYTIDISTFSSSTTAGTLPDYNPAVIYTWQIFRTSGTGVQIGGVAQSQGTDLTNLFNFSTQNWTGPLPAPTKFEVKVSSGGTGLDLIIVPEPTTIALAGIGIGAAVWFFRRRRAA